MKYLLMMLIRIYQRLISPLLGSSCRFHPSCSRYGYEALATHGTIKGTYLTVWRLLRCHPWNPGGYDPVPPRREHSGPTFTREHSGPAFPGAPLKSSVPHPGLNFADFADEASGARTHRTINVTNPQGV